MTSDTTVIERTTGRYVGMFDTRSFCNWLIAPEAEVIILPATKNPQQ